VQRNAALAVGALAGAAAALFLRRRPRTEPGAGPREFPQPDQAEELRRKLAQARATQADEDDFQAAGMGAETMVTEEPRPQTSISTPLPTTTATPPAPPSESVPAERAPNDEFEAMRRRVHEEGRAAAEEMRRRAEAEESPP
jgi:hypothetical protein